eukprot:m.303728 g.303728  ORF g.303728 m.303728 type:complete len:1233 (-) comp19594_c0_seq1:33-3731(-)
MSVKEKTPKVFRTYEFARGEVKKLDKTGILWRSWRRRKFEAHATTTGGHWKYFTEKAQDAHNPWHSWFAGLRYDYTMADGRQATRFAGFDKKASRADMRVEIQTSEKDVLHVRGFSAEERDVLIQIINASDLSDPVQAVRNVSDLFVWLTNTPSPLQFTAVEVSGGAGILTNHHQVYHLLSTERNGARAYRTQDTMLGKELYRNDQGHWVAQTAGILFSQDLVSGQKAALLEEVDSAWVGGAFDDVLELNFHGRLNVNVHAMLLCLHDLCKTRQVAESLVQGQRGTVQAIVERVRWRWPASRKSLVPDIIKFIKGLYVHWDKSDTIKAALPQESIPPLLRLLGEIESGRAVRGVNCNTVILGGRRGFNDRINGFYSITGEHNNRPMYTHSNGQLQLMWSNSKNRWHIQQQQPADGQSHPWMMEPVAYVEDNVETAEAIEMDWRVWWEDPEDEDNKHYITDSRIITKPLSHSLHSQSKALVNMLNTLCMRRDCALIAARNPAALRGMLIRVVAKIKHASSSLDMVEPILRLINRIGQYHERSSVVRDCLLGPDDILLLLIDVFMEASQYDIGLLSRSDSRFLKLVNMLVDIIKLPVEFRHDDDGRAAAVQHRLVRDVTPRMLDLTLRACKANITLASLLSDKVPKLVMQLSLLCELPEAAAVVGLRPRAMNQLLSTITRGVQTQTQKLNSETAMTVELGGFHPEAYEELLMLTATVSGHVMSNDGVAHGVFRADPVPILVRVLEVNTTDLCCRFAAQALFKLAEASVEHRETLARFNGIPALLHLLKTGTTASQHAAAHALAASLENHRGRQAQFLEAGGARSLVRLLQREKGSLAIGIAMVVASLTSSSQSASDLVDTGCVAALLDKLLEVDIDLQLKVARAILNLAESQTKRDVLQKELVEAGARDKLKAVLASGRGREVAKDKFEDDEDTIYDLKPPPAVPKEKSTNSDSDSDSASVSCSGDSDEDYSDSDGDDDGSGKAASAAAAAVAAAVAAATPTPAPPPEFEIPFSTVNEADGVSMGGERLAVVLPAHATNDPTRPLDPFAVFQRSWGQIPQSADVVLSDWLQGAGCSFEPPLAPATWVTGHTSVPPACVAISQDDGLTWRHGFLPVGGHALSIAHERSSNILGVSCSGTRFPTCGAAFVWSDDAGASWSEPMALDPERPLAPTSGATNITAHERAKFTILFDRTAPYCDEAVAPSGDFSLCKVSVAVPVRKLVTRVKKVPVNRPK